MDIFFFTAADDHYKHETEALIESAEYYGRKVHFYPIPAGKQWQRYKVELLCSDLPPADKYVYLDSDTVFNATGDWESDECMGVGDVLYYMSEAERLKQTKGFMRNHTCVIGEGKGYDYICKMWELLDLPIWCNSGVTVLDAERRLPFARSWRAWINQIDKHCQLGPMIGDEAALCFARQMFDLPLLPPRFNGLCKWQTIEDWHVLIHADGNVSGERRGPYTRAIEKVRAAGHVEG